MYCALAMFQLLTWISSVPLRYGGVKWFHLQNHIFVTVGLECILLLKTKKSKVNLMALLD